MIILLISGALINVSLGQYIPTEDRVNENLIKEG